MKSKTKRAALYAMVSTLDKGQYPETQNGHSSGNMPHGGVLRSSGNLLILLPEILKNGHGTNK
jgi:hypothetical protein